MEKTSLGVAWYGATANRLEALEGLRSVSIQQGSGWKMGGKSDGRTKLGSSLGHITKHFQNFGIHLFTLFPQISKAVSTCIMLGTLALLGVTEISSDLECDQPSQFVWVFLNFVIESLISQGTTQFQEN